MDKTEKASQMLEQQIKDMIERMCHTIETSVPAFGDFEPLVEGFENSDKTLLVNRFWIEVMHPPKGVKGRAWIRGLKMYANRIGSGSIVHILIEACTKEELLTRMRAPDYYKKLLRQTGNLSYNLEDL